MAGINLLGSFFAWLALQHRREASVRRDRFPGQSDLGRNVHRVRANPGRAECSRLILRMGLHHTDQASARRNRPRRTHCLGSVAQAHVRSLHVRRARGGRRLSIRLGLDRRCLGFDQGEGARPHSVGDRHCLQQWHPQRLEWYRRHLRNGRQEAARVPPGHRWRPARLRARPGLDPELALPRRGGAGARGRARARRRVHRLGEPHVQRRALARRHEHRRRHRGGRAARLRPGRHRQRRRRVPGRRRQLHRRPVHQGPGGGGQGRSPRCSASGSRARAPPGSTPP
jgi:hypothetical protein